MQVGRLGLEEFLVSDAVVHHVVQQEVLHYGDIPPAVYEEQSLEQKGVIIMLIHIVKGDRFQELAATKSRSAFLFILNKWIFPLRGEIS